MIQNQTIIVLYIIFIWFVIIHTFEEISQIDFGTQIGPIKVTKHKYLLIASLISTLNLGTLLLLTLNLSVGYYLAIFNSATIGMMQGVIHFVGFFRAGKKAKGLGSGFYSSIPLSVFAAFLFYQILKIFII